MSRSTTVIIKLYDALSLVTFVEIVLRNGKSKLVISFSSWSFQSIVSELSAEGGLAVCL